MSRFAMHCLVPALMALFLPAASAMADTPRSPADDFATLDLNQDARLDWKEYRNRVSEIFFFADANSDGRVDADESAALGPDVAIPAEGLTHARFLEAHREAYGQLDRDGDGLLSLAEATGG